MRPMEAESTGIRHKSPALQQEGGWVSSLFACHVCLQILLSPSLYNRGVLVAFSLSSRKRTPRLTERFGKRSTERERLQG
ncbi:unnamed protein product [Sphagnum jensenii]|uniref:Uncharacterized protein n=1 Tax=Sphagnum jensenii TaxID=128206 RepID=A0ABP1BJA3_9BRYO